MVEGPEDVEQLSSLLQSSVHLRHTKLCIPLDHAEVCHFQLCVVNLIVFSGPVTSFKECYKFIYLQVCCVSLSVARCLLKVMPGS